MKRGWDSMVRVRHALAQGAAKSMTVLLLVLATTIALAVPAKAWWNDDWSLRKKITIDASAAGANITDAIGTTPVLLRLHVGNFRFGSAKDDGSGLRFV